MKTCNVCKLDKEPSEFHANRTKKSGLQTKCKLCSSALFKKDYQARPELRARIRKTASTEKARKLLILRRYKRLCGCKLCNEKEPVALDLHHLDPAVKEGNIGTFLGGTMEKFKAEVRKCVVLCANCHRKVHAGLMQLGVVAQRDRATGSYPEGCRCDSYQPHQTNATWLIG